MRPLDFVLFPVVVTLDWKLDGVCLRVSQGVTQETVGVMAIGWEFRFHVDDCDRNELSVELCSLISDQTNLTHCNNTPYRAMIVGAQRLLHSLDPCFTNVFETKRLDGL